MERNKFKSLIYIFSKKNILLIVLNQVFLFLSVSFGYFFFQLFQKSNYKNGAIFLSVFFISLVGSCISNILLTKNYDAKTTKSDFDCGRFVYAFSSIAFTGILFTIFAYVVKSFKSTSDLFVTGIPGIIFAFLVFVIYLASMYLNYIFSLNNESNSN